MTTTDAEPDPRRWLALAVIGLAQLMIVLDISIVNIALPHAQADLGISDVNRQWVVTAYVLAFGGLLLLGGRVGDYVGRKRSFLIGLFGFAGASMLGGLAQGEAMLFGARALQGVFAALLAPAALSLIAVTFTDTRERAKAFGVYGALSGGGGAVGLILGGMLTEYASWRWCLFVNVPIAVGAGLAALPTIRESRADGDRHYDVPGATLVTLGLLSLVFAFTKAAEDGVGWSATSTLGLLGAAAVLLVAFVVTETRTAHPLLPLRVVLERNRGGALLASFLLGSGMFGMFLFLSYYFQVNLGYTALKSGLAILPFSGGIVFAAGLASSLLPRTGPKPLMVVGMGLATLGLGSLALIGSGSSYLFPVLPGLVVMSVGVSLVIVPMSSVALFGVAPGDAGVTSAMLNTTQQVGGALGTALLNTFYVSAVASYSSSHRSAAAGARALQLDGFLHGYRIAFVVGAALFAAALVTIVALIRAEAPGDSAPGPGAAATTEPELAAA